jgi:hypothetical protein
MPRRTGTRLAVQSGWRRKSGHASASALVTALLLHIRSDVSLRAACDIVNRETSKKKGGVSKSSLQRLYQSLPASLREADNTNEASVLDFIQQQQEQQRVGISQGLSLLTLVEEELIVQWVGAMWEINWPVTRSAIKDRARLVITVQRGSAYTKPLRKWYSSFRGRHPELCDRVAQNVSKARLLAQDREDNIAHYFSLLADYKDLPPAQIFAGDETGLDGDGAREVDVVVPTGATRVSKQLDSYREHTSLMHIGNAAGRSLPMMFMFKGAELDTTFLPDLPADSLVAAQKCGYFTGEHFICTLQHLDKHGGEARPLLFIIDGCKGHINLAAIDFARSKHIHILCLPANLTHLLQVADVALFGPFKRYWRRECAALKERRASEAVQQASAALQHGGVADNIISSRDIKRADIAPLAIKAWALAMKEDSVKAGFRRTGIYPYDPTAWKQSLPHSPLRPLLLPVLVSPPAVLAAQPSIARILPLLPVTAPPQATVKKCSECGSKKKAPRRTVSTGAGVMLTGDGARQVEKLAEAERLRQKREERERKRDEKAAGSVSGRKRGRDEVEEKENVDPNIGAAQQSAGMLHMHPGFGTMRRTRARGQL